MNDPRDYKLDLTASSSSTPATPVGRPYVSVHFACCNVYLRIYRSADGKHYRGRCPRCGVPVQFVVGDGGTDVRVFTVR